MPPRPIIGITTDVLEGRARVMRAYAEAVTRCGAIPVLISPPVDERDAAPRATDHLDAVHALVFTGGDDPRTEPFGVPTDPRVTPVEPTRQAYETALARLAFERDVPTLGVCLGMQMLALCSGGALDQWMPDTTPTHDDHWSNGAHDVVSDTPRFPSGRVTSHHRQAITDPGSMRVIARAHDGVIEAIEAPNHRYMVGVQWHPERTEQDGLGDALFRQLVQACA